MAQQPAHRALRTTQPPPCPAGGRSPAAPPGSPSSTPATLPPHAGYDQRIGPGERAAPGASSPPGSSPPHRRDAAHNRRNRLGVLARPGRRRPVVGDCSVDHARAARAKRRQAPALLARGRRLARREQGEHPIAVVVRDRGGEGSRRRSRAGRRAELNCASQRAEAARANSDYRLCRRADASAVPHPVHRAEALGTAVAGRGSE